MKLGEKKNLLRWRIPPINLVSSSFARHTNQTVKSKWRRTKLKGRLSEKRLYGEQFQSNFKWFFSHCSWKTSGILCSTWHMPVVLFQWLIQIWKKISPASLPPTTTTLLFVNENGRRQLMWNLCKNDYFWMQVGVYMCWVVVWQRKITKTASIFFCLQRLLFSCCHCYWLLDFSFLIMQN